MRPPKCNCSPNQASNMESNRMEFNHDAYVSRNGPLNQIPNQIRSNFVSRTKRQ